MNLKMQMELKEQMKASKYGEMPRQMALAFLIAMIGLGIAYILIIAGGWFAGGENAMKMPNLMISRQLEQGDALPTLDEGLEVLADWSDTVGEESTDIVGKAESKVDDFGKQVADMVGQGFIVTAIIIVLAFTIAGFLKGGPSGAAMGAAFGITLGAGVYLIWYNLYHGHVIPVVISFAIAIGSLWQLPKSIAWFIGISAIVVFGFWPLIMPQSWAIVNILNIVEADSWYDFWYMIQGGDFGIFSPTGL